LILLKTLITAEFYRLLQVIFIKLKLQSRNVATGRISVFSLHYAALHPVNLVETLNFLLNTIFQSPHSNIHLSS